jgi:hypothetical protein
MNERSLSKACRMSQNYIQLTKTQMQELPVIKQAQVYDFAKYLKSRSRYKRRDKKSRYSIHNLVGMRSSDVNKLSVNTTSIFMAKESVLTEKSAFIALWR